MKMKTEQIANCFGAACTYDCGAIAVKGQRQ